MPELAIGGGVEVGFESANGDGGAEGLMTAVVLGRAELGFTERAFE